jgi:Ca-activated chloride channel family protein
MPNVTISVVGIAIPADEVDDIACFSELTGGLYLRAGDASGFRTNLAQALAAAWSEPTPPPPPMPTARIDIPAGIVQGLPVAVAYQGPLDPRDEIRISWFGTAPQAHIVGALIHPDGTPVMLTAPAERGAYELRYWHAARQTVIATARLQVVPVEAGLEVPPRVLQGAIFSVVWRAEPRGEEQLIIARPGDAVDAALFAVEVGRTERTVQLTAPADVGQYEVRLVRVPPPPVEGLAASAALAAPVVIATVPLEVVQAAATLTPAAPIVAGARFAVAWTGPGGMNDDIQLGLPGQAAVAAERPTGEAVTFVAPFPAGRYELRYLSAATGTVIATVPVDVTAPTATLDVPAEIIGGATFAVAWTGPGGANDRIVIAPNRPPGSPAIANSNVSALGRPIVFDAPLEAGKYEVRYLAGREGATIVTRTFDVVAPRVSLAVNGAIVAGQPFAVQWEGPAGRYDEIRLIPAGQPTDTIIDAFRVSPDAPAQLTAPAAPGTYALVYWAGAANRALATQSITIAAP